MRIMIVSCAFPPHIKGGVAKLLSNLSTAFVKRGHEVYIFSLMDNISTKKYATVTNEFDGVHATFINIPMSSLTNFESRYRSEDYYNHYVGTIFKSHIKKIDPDIIHFHSIQGLGANLIKEAHKEGYPTVLTMHDWWWFCPNLFMVDLQLNICKQNFIDLDKCNSCLRRLTNRTPDDINIGLFLKRRKLLLEEVLLKDVDIILTVSQTLRKFAMNNINIDIHLNENGIPKPSAVKSKDLNPKKIIFGFFGARSDLKGYNILINAFTNLPLSNWELHIHGVEKPNLKSILLNFKNKNLWKSFMHFLHSNIETSSPNQKIKYHTYVSQSNMDETIANVDIVIVPSVMRESFSLITREALILKIPVICSDCGGPEEIVKNNINGFIFKTSNVSNLRESIIKILSNPNIVDIFKNNINIDEIKLINDQCKELEDLYITIINHRNRYSAVHPNAPQNSKS